MLPGLICQYQLVENPGPIDLVRHSVNGSTFSQIRIGARVEGIGLPRAGRIFCILITSSVTPHIYDGFPLVQGDLGIRTTSNWEGHQALQPGYEAWILDFPRETLATLLNSDPLKVWGELALCSREMHDWVSLDRFFSVLGKLSRENRIAEHRIADGLAERMVQTFSVGESPDLPRARAARYRRFLQARELIHYDPLIGVVGLCQSLGVSARTLRRLFIEFCGTSTTTYSQSLRLSRARSDLLLRTYERGLVSEVAAKHGFWHLGRFSTNYKKLFGERPSATLKREKRYRRSYGLGEYGVEMR